MKHQINLQFIPIFHELDTRKEFDGIFCTVEGILNKCKMKLDLIGPFLFFTKSEESSPLFMLFIPHYSAATFFGSGTLTVTIRTTFDTNVFLLYFQTKSSIDEFMMVYYSNFGTLDKFYQDKKCEDLFNSGSLLSFYSSQKKLCNCKCLLLRDNSNSYIFEARKTKKQSKCFCRINLTNLTLVLALIKIPGIFHKHPAPITFYFTICDIQNIKNFGIFQCPDLSKCVNWILSIYGWIQISSRKEKPPPIKIDQPFPTSKSQNAIDKEDEDSAASPSLIIQDLYSVKKGPESVHPISKYQLLNNRPPPLKISAQSQSTTNFFKPEQFLDDNAISISDTFSSNSSQESTINPYTLNTTSPPLTPPLHKYERRQSNVVDLNIPVKYLSPTNKKKTLVIQSTNKSRTVTTVSHPDELPFTKDARLIENEEKLKDELEKERTLSQQVLKQHKASFKLPSIKNHSVSTESTHVNSVENIQQQIGDILTLFKHTCHNINLCEQISDSKISSSFLYPDFEPSEEKDTDLLLNDLFDTNESRVISNETIKQNLKEEHFPNFPFEEFYNAQHPKIAMIDEIAFLTQSIQTHFFDQVRDSSDTDRFCFLIASLFANGMKGFETFESPNNFLKSIIEISPQVDGLFEICEVIENRTKTTESLSSQLSLFSTTILNKQLLVPLLKTILVFEEWGAKYYKKNSYMCNDKILESICLIVDLISKLQFELSPRTSIITRASIDDKKRFVFTPPLTFLELNEIDHNESKMVVQRKICDIFVQMMREGCIKKTAWQFVLEIADSEPPKKCPEFQNFVSYVKKMPWSLDEKEKIRKLTRHALKLSVLHTWFSFMFTNQRITTNYYLPDSVLCDLYKAKYVFSFILEYEKH